MMAAMAGGLPYSLEEIPHRIGLVTLGVFLSCIIAVIFSLLVLKPNISKDIKETLSQLSLQNDVDYLEAVIIGIFMSSSFFIAHFLGLDNPYWVPISCLAVMQGVTRQHIWRRGLYRVLGTILGMLLCGMILSFLQAPIEIIIAIMVLQFLVELFIVKNYFFAVLFVTPMTVLLSEAGHSLTLDPDLLVISRLKDVLLGSLLGIIGGWVIYNERLRFHFVKRVRLTKKILKK
ncbi:FUSC family protein [Chryseobacterium sp. T1]